MTEKRGDRFDTHAPVDGLGGQSVTELVGCDVPDAGGRRGGVTLLETLSESAEPENGSMK